MVAQAFRVTRHPNGFKNSLPADLISPTRPETKPGEAGSDGGELMRKRSFRYVSLSLHSATSRMLTMPTARSPETTGM
jgi:hypothetical protein